LHFRLGHILSIQGPSDEAIAALEKALVLRPGYPEVLDVIGVALSYRDRLEEALAASRQATAAMPDSAITHNNLGTVLQKCELPEEAVAEYRKALELSKGYPEAQNNLGSALWDSGYFEEGCRELAKGLELQPGYSAIEANLGMMMLTLGDFESGWKRYEARQKLIPVSLDHHPSAEWDGSDLHGKRIIIQPEQGFGDTIQFARYVPMVAGRGGRVILLCQPELRRILSTLNGVERVVGQDEPLPEFEIRTRLMSLPGIFKSNLETIPGDVPYLCPEAGLVARWRERLAKETDGLKIGLAWAGSPTHPLDRQRSVGLTDLRGLGRVEGVRFFSLQKGTAGRQLPEVAGDLHITDWTGELNDFADTAALVANLDLVISVDSAVAHLTGAMGVPAWVLVQFAPDWRWLLNRTDSPWYPGMKLYRQSRRADWSTPIAQMIEQLTLLKSS
jgi:Tfp pilus assembly protein PilF